MAMGPLVLVFFRGPTSPACVEQLRDYRRRHAALYEAGATVVAICSGDRDAARALREQERLPFRLLVDEDGSVLTAWGLRSASGELRTATFVLDKAGIVRFRSIETDESQAPTPSACVLDYLRGHGGEGQAQG
jgi:peroxiredoxin